MNAVIAPNTRLTTVVMCPIVCPVAIPLTTMNTTQQGRNGAAQGSNWDGTLLVSRDHSPTRAARHPLLAWRLS